ncbi:MAG: hypothetical protein NVS4B7_16770 [Ktedonobacteraceae bacterium]
MSRKDSEKDADRPHYYSQFWLDVAAGRRTIGTPKTNEEDDLEPEMGTVLLRKASGRNNIAAISDGYAETIAHPEVEAEFEPEELAKPEFADLEQSDEVEEMEQDEEVDEIALPDVAIEEEEIPDVELTPVEEEEEIFADEEDEEDEEDIGWSGGRGRKKPKPGRQAKLPVKKPKREPRRGF